MQSREKMSGMLSGKKKKKKLIVSIYGYNFEFFGSNLPSRQGLSL